MISRLAGEPDSAEDVLSLLRQAHEQEVFDADTLLRLEKVLDFADLEVRDAMITRSHMNVLKENDSIERITAYVIETAHSRFPRHRRRQRRSPRHPACQRPAQIHV